MSRPNPSSTSDLQASVEHAAEAVKQGTHAALDKLQNGVDTVSDAAPAMLSRAAARMEELSRRTLERARQAGTQVKDQAHRAGDVTVSYIKDEPVKAVLIAAAAGALAAGLLGWLARSRVDRR